MSSAPWMPPPLSPADAAEFRRRLVSPKKDAEKPSVFDVKAIRKEAVSFVRLLVDLYRRSHASTDRIDIWEHIVKALTSAGAAVSPDDFAAFACHCLPHIQCEISTAATHEPFQNLIGEERPPEWREAMIRYLTGPMMAAAVGKAKAEDKSEKLAKGSA